MKIINDSSAYDKLQLYLTKIIATDVREMLEQAGMQGSQLKDAAEAITFGIATIIDGSRMMEHEGTPVVPVLTFGILDEDDELSDLLSIGESSFMSEYATSTVAELFSDVAPPGQSPPVA
jgi:hypothetical protein